ncbi:MAG: Ribonuclease P protein component [candidate division WS6 bacterium GW2011_GWF2_39_15]|uniref:Ribonuclease P protein component n=1 Tax=candidate division WS6 bacterium GW2011_GWF2_39_15 TaxID=1619100 RepID=A0A0G0MY81_9BACT|nr:MAG: Ribonuclease P protein component [candidate division WS6 bacterium GW2011_GWF2_39_15]
MFPKTYKLSPNDFRRVYDKGTKVRGEFGMLIVLKDSVLDHYRIGFVVNNKVGNAVQRHLLTRRLKSLFRRYDKSIPLPPMLFEYVAFKQSSKYELLEKEFINQLNTVSKK